MNFKQVEHARLLLPRKGGRGQKQQVMLLTYLWELHDTLTRKKILGLKPEASKDFEVSWRILAASCFFFSAWVLIPLANGNPVIFSVPPGTEKLNKSSTLPHYYYPNNVPIYLWKLPETVIPKAWPDRKRVMSAGLNIFLGCSKKFYKKTLSFSPPENTSKS